MTSRPEFRLDRHDHSRCDGVMEIVSVADLRADTAMPRRAAVRAGLTVAGAIALLTACSDPTPATPATPAPTATPTPTPAPAPAPTTTPSPAPTTRPPAAAVPVPAPVPRSAPRTTAPKRRPTPKRRRPGGVETVPCDSKPIPPGKICTCNCVPVR